MKTSRWRRILDQYLAQEGVSNAVIQEDEELCQEQERRFVVEAEEWPMPSPYDLGNTRMFIVWTDGKGARIGELVPLDRFLGEHN